MSNESSPMSDVIKLPVRYDDDTLRLIGSDGEAIAELDLWLEELDEPRMGDFVAKCINEHESLQSQLTALKAERDILREGLEHYRADAKRLTDAFNACWEDVPLTGDEPNCQRCGGMLYIEQGGEIVDCSSCNGEGVQRPPKNFNAEKWAELQDCEIIGNFYNIDSRLATSEVEHGVEILF